MAISPKKRLRPGLEELGEPQLGVQLQAGTIQKSFEPKAHHPGFREFEVEQLEALSRLPEALNPDA